MSSWQCWLFQFDAVVRHSQPIEWSSQQCLPAHSHISYNIQHTKWQLHLRCIGQRHECNWNLLHKSNWSTSFRLPAAIVRVDSTSSNVVVSWIKCEYIVEVYVGFIMAERRSRNFYSTHSCIENLLLFEMCRHTTHVWIEFIIFICPRSACNIF